MNLLIGIILLFALFLLLLLLAIYLKTKNQGKNLMKRAGELDNFTISQFIMGQQSSFLFVADNKGKRLAYLQDSEDYVFPFDAVISAELFRNNESISERVSRRVETDMELDSFYKQTRAEKMFSGSFSETGKNKNSRITVRIILVGHHKPFIDIDCFDAKTQLFAGSRTLDLTNHESQIYRLGLQIGHHLLMLLGKVIDQVDTVFIKDKQFKFEPNSVDLMPHLIADELEKLSLLRDKGVLSDEEFDSQKRRLLNS